MRGAAGGPSRELAHDVRESDPGRPRLGCWRNVGVLRIIEANPGGMEHGWHVTVTWENKYENRNNFRFPDG